MLQDGDFELAQSNTILRYLARKHGAMKLTHLHFPLTPFHLLAYFVGNRKYFVIRPSLYMNMNVLGWWMVEFC